MYIVLCTIIYVLIYITYIYCIYYMYVLFFSDTTYIQLTNTRI